MVRLPVDFRHRQTKRNLPPRALSAKVQQMPLLWQTLGGNTLPPRSADLHLRIATDGKDRCVSRQARQTSFNPCLSGFLVCALRWCLRSCALYIDNGGLFPQSYDNAVSPAAGTLATCQPVWQRLVPDHLTEFCAESCCGLFAHSGENSSFIVLAFTACGCHGGPSCNVCGGHLCYPLDPCFHFSLATKCLTHLK